MHFGKVSYKNCSDTIMSATQPFDKRSKVIRKKLSTPLLRNVNQKSEGLFFHGEVVTPVQQVCEPFEALPIKPL